MDLKRELDPRLARIMELEWEISIWRYSNSQSQPGAVMHLRFMKRELEALKKKLFEK